MSVVNLLPAAKTYNVAKITSNQKAFGAGVVIDPINVGVAAGKSKNRLYLAKDTDTVALQYYPSSNTTKPRWIDGARLVDRSAQEDVLDVAHVLRAWQEIGNACADDPAPDLPADGHDYSDGSLPLVFGWQFRPVLGAEYVQAGDRQVFAQIALPVGLGERWAPYVFVQTRWREYDEKNQVVGPVYSGSCSVRSDPEPIMIDSNLEVDDVHVDDMGGGVVKVSAAGEFYEQGFSVMSGPNTIAPASFDGKKVQFFANAANLLLMDDLQLRAEDGRTVALGMRASYPEECRIRSASLNAVPRPDGTSLVEARITTGDFYSLDQDKAPDPLFLIGTQVCGLHETPFLEPRRGACRQRQDWLGADLGGVSCTYRFLAPTSALRTAETFKVRDLAWQEFGMNGTIEFDPAFTSLANLATVKAPDPDNPLVCAGHVKGYAKCPVNPPCCGAKENQSGNSDQTEPIYTLTGTDFQRIRSWNCSHSGCLELYRGFEPYPLGSGTFQTVGSFFSPTSEIQYCAATFVIGSDQTCL